MAVAAFVVRLLFGKSWSARRRRQMRMVQKGAMMVVTSVVMGVDTYKYIQHCGSPNVAVLVALSDVVPLIAFTGLYLVTVFGILARKRGNKPPASRRVV